MVFHKTPCVNNPTYTLWQNWIFQNTYIFASNETWGPNHKQDNESYREVQNPFLADVLSLQAKIPPHYPTKTIQLMNGNGRPPIASGFQVLAGVVSTKQFNAIQIARQVVIAGNPEKLGIFGYFYFVMGAMGIKQHTNCVISDDGMNPYESLRAKVNYGGDVSDQKFTCADLFSIPPMDCTMKGKN